MPLQGFHHGEFLHLPRQEQPGVYIHGDGTLISSTTPLNITASTHRHHLLPPRPTAFMCSPHQIPTDQSGGRNLLLLNHRSAGSNPPRDPRRNSATIRIRSPSSLATVRARSSCRLVHSSQDPAGCVRERDGRPPHGDLKSRLFG